VRSEGRALEATRQRHPAGPRTLCVLVPEWPLEVARQAGALPSDPSGPAAVHRQGIIVAASAEARAEGVRLGQKRREAESICPTLTVAESDPGAEATAFEPVALAIESLIPRLEIAEPGLAIVSAAGALRYYGGADATARAVHEAARSAGAPTARVGLARGPFAARLAALYAPANDPVLVLDPAAEPDFLTPLRVSVLEDPLLTTSLRRLGIHTLGELATLPRSAVVARFGAVGLEAHRLACGEDRLPSPRQPSDDLAVEMIFDPPLADLETTAFAARSLAGTLTATLEAQGLSAFAVKVEVEAEPADSRGRLCPGSADSLHRTWRSLDPLSERALADRARWQLTAWSEAGMLPGGLTRLQLTPLDLTGHGRQLSLFRDAAAEAEAGRSFARIQALLGPDSVRRAVLQGGRGPHDHFRYVRHGEPASPAQRDRPCDAPWPGHLPPPAPALVVPVPTRIDVREKEGIPRSVSGEEVLSFAGPWRLREAWWDSERARDLEWWQIVTASGARLVARSGDGWTLHALYD
jgi:protein ImuB